MYYIGNFEKHKITIIVYTLPCVNLMMVSNMSFNKSENHENKFQVGIKTVCIFTYFVNNTMK